MMDALLETIEARQELYFAWLKQAILIRSVAENKEEKKRILELFATFARSFSCSCTLLDDQVLVIRYGQGLDYIGVFAHLDVVEAGLDWSTPPFKLSERDAFLIGRGIVDDKGPALACLYALYCIAQLAIPLLHPIWLVLGTKEEEGMDDLALFLKKQPRPRMGFVPDSLFPIVQEEMGIADFQVEFSSPALLKIWKERYVPSDQTIEKQRVAIRHGIEEEGRLCFSIRYPSSLSVSSLETFLKTTLGSNPLVLVQDRPPVLFDRDAGLYRTLLQSYESIKGAGAQARKAPGRSYASGLAHVVPFGPQFPQKTYAIHGSNEKMARSELLDLCRIYGLALLALATKKAERSA